MADALPTEAPQTDAASTDLGCPGCGYNLRGLPAVIGEEAMPRRQGYVVACPECGLKSNLAELATRRWDKPWYKAPGFHVLTGPVAWLVLGGIGVLAVLSGLQAGQPFGATTGWLVMLVASFILFVGWTVLIAWVWGGYGGPVGVLFSLLAHIVLPAYLAGLVLVVAGVVNAVMVFVSPQNSADLLSLLIGVSMTAVGIGLFIGGRLCERQIAFYCIRLHLRRRPTG